MSAHKKDLHPWNGRTDRDSTPVVIVTDDSPYPVLKSLYIHGIETLLPADASVSLELDANDLSVVNIPVLASSLEIITAAEAEERIVKE